MLVYQISVSPIFSQTADSYEGSSEDLKSGLLDPSRFTVNRSVSFGMSSASNSSIKSQSLYSTMIQYEFAKPVTLNLNFGLPIHSTYNQMQNLNADNIRSADYFKNIPFDVSLTWQPKDNLLMRFSVIRRTMNEYSTGFYSPLYYNGLWDN